MSMKEDVIYLINAKSSINNQISNLSKSNMINNNITKCNSENVDSTNHVYHRQYEKMDSVKSVKNFSININQVLNHDENECKIKFDSCAVDFSNIESTILCVDSVMPLGISHGEKNNLLSISSITQMMDEKLCTILSFLGLNFTHLAISNEVIQ